MINDSSSASHQSGFSLIEVLVGMALSLISLAVIIQLFSVSDARKRVTTGGAESQQVAAINMYQIGRSLRIGGASFTQGSVNLWGCLLQVSVNGTVTQPATLAYSPVAPFAAIETNLRLLPAVIYAGAGANGSDTIVTMAGTGPAGASEYPIEYAGAAASIQLKQTNGFRPNDILLAIGPVEDNRKCRITQVGPNATDVTRNSFNAGGVLAYPLTDLGVERLLNLGPAPNFFAYGIDGDNRLRQFDFLNLTGNLNSVIADNVVDLRAVYGIDTDDDGVINSWVAPTGTYSSAALAAPVTSTAHLRLIDQIRAIRLALVIRSPEATIDNPQTSYQMFSDLAGLAITQTIPSALQRQRVQVYETTIMLRNMRYVPLAASRQF